MSVYLPCGSRSRSRPLRLAASTALVGVTAALAACTAQPRYPITAGTPLGAGGFKPEAPAYPIRPGEARPSEGVRVSGDDSGGAPIRTGPPTAPPAAPSEDFSVGRPVGSGSVDRAALPPLSAPSAPVPYAQLQRPPERATPVRAAAPRPEVAAKPAPVRRAPPTLSYVVAKGDTLYGLGRRFSLAPGQLAAFNDLSLKDHLALDQKLKLPPAAKDGGEQTGASGEMIRTLGRIIPPLPTPPTPRPRLETAAAKPVTPAPAEVAPAAPPPAPRLTYGRPRKTEGDAAAAVAEASTRAPIAAPAAPAASAVTSDVSSTQAAQAGRGRFIRPVAGEVLSGFGVKGPGQRNDGVDFSAREGEDVRAAASGVVVYAGHDVPALGNLVAVKHADGWVTVYGNLEKITVKPRDQVTQGSQVGIAGQTTVTPRPQVHFEVRYSPDPAERARPIDPTLVLPRAG